MDQNPSALYNYTEFNSLKRIDAELWNSLSKQLQNKKCYENVNLKPLIKLQKSLNNRMLKMISETARESTPTKPPVDEVEGGFVMT